MSLLARFTALLALLMLVVAPTLGGTLTQRPANAAAGLAMAPRDGGDGGDGTRSWTGQDHTGGEAVVEKRHFASLKEFREIGLLDHEADIKWVQGNALNGRRGWILYMLADGWQENPKKLATVWAGTAGTKKTGFFSPDMFTHKHTHGVSFYFRATRRYILIVSQRLVNAEGEPYRRDEDKDVDDEDKIGWQDEKQVKTYPDQDLPGELRFDGAVLPSGSTSTDRMQFRIRVKERDTRS